jgi:superfamily II DNA or RNA helicase
VLLPPSARLAFRPADVPRDSTFLVDVPDEAPHALSVADFVAMASTLAADEPFAAAAGWARAALAGLIVISRGLLYPAAAGTVDTWRVGPLEPSDLNLAGRLGHSLRPDLDPAGAAQLVRLLWDAIADTLVRTAAAPLVTGPAFAAGDHSDVRALAPFLAEADRSATATVRPRLVVDLPVDPGGQAQARLAVVDLHTGAAIDAADLWSAAPSADALPVDAAEQILLALRRGASAWPALGTLLASRAPSAMPLTAADVRDLLADGGSALVDAGTELAWPGALRADALTVRAVVSDGSGGLSLGAITDIRWEVLVDGEPLTDAETAQLLATDHPLVHLRGRWILTDPSLLERVRSRRRSPVGAATALGAVLAGGMFVDGEQVDVIADGALAELADRLRRAATEDPDDYPPPDGLVATLRDYQRRGLRWLAHMSASGLGACLADDMGLGKTVQVIALHLARAPLAAGPTLVICPASVVGNWQRELARFAPTVPVRRYHGEDRSLADLTDDTVVVASYGILRRDYRLLAAVRWGLAVADEAQMAKNPSSLTARALRAVPAAARVALTGTPVENRLADLWSILDWAIPGLLGPHEQFRRAVEIPVERFHDDDVAERLARMIRPFVLRRRKSDPLIVPELPPKTETDHPVPLTAEQAALYRTVVTETSAEIAGTLGMQRRGLVLRLLTELKQVCNHPAQFLREAGPLDGRSGKLAALDELVDIVVAEGESMLVFTQFVQMGRLIHAHLAARGQQVGFLHGSMTLAAREQLVDRFQAGDVRILVLSLRAGGLGLNLTRASHVVHYDRWWNPAVEDQATDRAYRIGQDKPVQIHRLITEGTLEDRIAALLAAKRHLADAVVGGGEAWLTELSDDELADLVRLGAAP